MLIEYIDAAMGRAKVSPLKETGGFYGEIPECQGVWARAPTVDECKQALREVLEGWIFVRIKKGLEIPIIKGHAFGII